MAARDWCLRHRFPFTTSYHTQFPSTCTRVRRFRSRSAMRTCAAFTPLPCEPWSRRRLCSSSWKNAAFATSCAGLAGSTSSCSSPDRKDFWTCRGRSSCTWGRVAVEKNIEAFLALNLPGTMLVIGDGPARPSLQAKFPAAHFVGYKFGAELAAHPAATDVFVFPSRTDTFGLVLLEALACGVPVAAYPVTGPIDLIENGATGVLDEDLHAAALAALQLDPAHCRAFALTQTWEAATRQFVGNLQPRPGEEVVRLKPDPQRVV
jgi:glycosyltransferase involved in cell wall biosynthesis